MDNMILPEPLTNYELSSDGHKMCLHCFLNNNVEVGSAEDRLAQRQHHYLFHTAANSYEFLSIKSG